MIKARIIKVTNIENKQIIMAMTIRKRIITKVLMKIILITIMRMRIKIGNRINI